MSVAAPSRSAGLRRWWPWVVLAVIVVALVVLAGPPGSGGQTLDPASSEPNGAKALVEILRGLDAEVRVAAPPVDADIVLVLIDRLDDASREAVRDFAAGGGVVVVTDPGSPLVTLEPVGGLATGGLADLTLEPDCDEPGVAEVGSVSATSYSTFVVPDDATGCFEANGGSALVVLPVGRGEQVVFGAPGALTNAAIGNADNALLAAGLLAPTPGTRIQILPSSAPGGGSQALTDLVPGGVHQLLAILALAFVLAAIASGRRLGDPVEEDLPVRVPGSELVKAVGNLLQRSRNRDEAAATLRAAARIEVAARLGVGRDAAQDPTARVLAELVAAPSGLDAATVRAALADATVASDDELMILTRRLAAVRRALDTTP